MKPRPGDCVNIPADGFGSRCTHMTADPQHLITARHYQTRRAVEIAVAGETISSVRELSGAVDETLPWVAPGFIDIQSNGYGGQEFSSPQLTVEKVASIVARQPAFGVTQFCPTVTTAASETIVHAMRTISQACDQSPRIARAVPGIHLEGPYITREDGPRGAHPLEHCRPPDWEEFRRFQAAAGGRIRLVTLSPEYSQAPEFTRRAVGSGVVVAIGHTAADSDQIRAVVDAGATLSTHLGNGRTACCGVIPTTSGTKWPMTGCWPA